MNTSIHLSIIGHTNTGKTSLMRTLTRNSDFGEVKNATATTRHVSAVNINGTDGTPLVVLYDTPGLEDATGVMDYLHEHTDIRADGVERLQQFLQAVTQGRISDDYSQEAKVIQTLLDTDIAIYVVDAREPILSKYKDELAILASSGTPVLPVFNFITSSDSHMQAWQDMLTRRALHVMNSFDTAAFDFNSEMQLWDNLHTLTREAAFNELRRLREQRWAELSEQGSLLIADFLVNVATFSQKIPQEHATEPTLHEMQQGVRQGFSMTCDKLLTLYQFYHATLDGTEISIDGATQDIFDAALLARYGIRTAGGSVAGMIIGAGVDVATLGTSMGLGTAVGGVLGGLLPNSTTIKDKAMGVKTLSIDNATITLLATRLQSLHHTLRHRGHASLEPVAIRGDIALPWQANKLPSPLKKSRANSHYCSLGGQHRLDDKRALRAEYAEKLTQVLEQHLTHLSA